MAFAYTRQERADLNAKASSLLNAYPDVGSFIAKGSAAILTPTHWSISARRSILRQ